MKILFLGDVVGLSGCSKVIENLSDQIKKNNIDLVIINGENADTSGVGLTKEICEEFGLVEGANSKPGQYVVEKAFVG